MSKGYHDACLRLTALGALAMGVCAGLLPLMPTPWTMAAMLLPFKFLSGFPPVLITSAIQIVAPNRLRAQLGSIFLLSVGVIGVSAGPIIPALLTDHVFHDDHALKYSLALATAFVCPIAFGLLWLGLKQYRERVQSAAAGS
jgi:MFS family permease